MKKILLAITILSLSFSALLAQETMTTAPGGNGQSEESMLYLKRTTDKIVLDGVLDEASWFSGRPAASFWQYFPVDSAQAIGQTEIYMAYDDEMLYVGVKCTSTDDQYIVPSLKRDYRFSGNDNISLLFDTYNDQTNAFLFGINPLGVCREALISNGGRDRNAFSESWDNKWFGEAKIHGDYWIAEFAIPFKTLRFEAGSTNWRFNCYRFDTNTNEVTTWMRIPRNQIIMDLTYMGDMQWEEPLPKSKKNISIIPYAIGGVARDFEDVSQDKSQLTYNVGGDAKIAVTSGLNLDLTVNPDFSQVEVDRQVTNLSRFEIFFPERRQFFLENADLFGSFGFSRTNPFFSRRIGVAQDTLEDANTISSTILYGARLSGKLNENLRLGILNMQTAKDGEWGLPGFNYTVATLQQKVFKRSNISFILANKQAIRGEDNSPFYKPYNRVAGLEYRVASTDNRWSGKYYYHQAFTPDDTPQKMSHGSKLEYRRRRYRFEMAHIFVGEGFNAELGFVPRRDFLMFSPEAEIYFYPQKGILNQHSINLDYRHIYKLGKDGTTWMPPNNVADRGIELNWRMSFKNNTRGGLTLRNTYIYLFNDFDPTRIQEESIFLPAGTAYTYTNVEANYNSDSRKQFSFRVSPTIGQFFNGFRAGVRGSFSMRFQPYGAVSLDYSYNRIRLDAPFVPSNLWLVGPRFDLTLTKKIFFSTIVQYNNQSDNLNINARFQWRFQPVSDFFIVYSDNYLTEEFSNFGVRNRALVAKVTYWLNL